jgi:hypothetical protein
MLQAAIDAEVEAFVDANRHRTNEQGRRVVVKNGSLPTRDILTGAGSIEVKQGRIRDNSADPAERVEFTPSILPAYLRRTDTIEELIPWLYLKGISTSDFGEALQALVGERAKGLSANVIVRLKEKWGDEYDTSVRRSIKDRLLSRCNASAFQNDTSCRPSPCDWLSQSRTTTATPPLAGLIGGPCPGVSRDGRVPTLLQRASLVPLLALKHPRLGFDVLTPNSGPLLLRNIAR